jgi:N-acetylglucosaminyl-diphospho-decaprenol L-rhamnosyltransferase
LGIAPVDVIVVSFNSSAHLRGCVELFAGKDDYTVFVVDNASADDSLDTISDLPVTAIQLDVNGGFAHGNNVALARGTSDLVLFVNPDARIEPDAVQRLAALLDASGQVGAAAPRIVDEDGALHFSQRRFPKVRSTFARAFFLHHIFPRAPWTDDLIRDEAAYRSARETEWVSGACILARRDILEQLGGWDDDFFLYGEDIDLCTRIWKAGYEVVFDPSAEAVHVGGASADRSKLAPILAESRIRYARKHRGELTAFLIRAALALDALARLVVTRNGWKGRRAYVRSLRVILSPVHARPTATPTSAG